MSIDDVFFNHHKSYPVCVSFCDKTDAQKDGREDEKMPISGLDRLQSDSGRVTVSCTLWIRLTYRSENFSLSPQHMYFTCYMVRTKHTCISRIFMSYQWRSVTTFDRKFKIYIMKIFFPQRILRKKEFYLGGCSANDISFLRYDLRVYLPQSLKCKEY